MSTGGEHRRHEEDKLRRHSTVKQQLHKILYAKEDSWSEEDKEVKSDAASGLVDKMKSQNDLLARKREGMKKTRPTGLQRVDEGAADEFSEAWLSTRSSADLPADLLPQGGEASKPRKKHGMRFTGKSIKRKVGKLNPKSVKPAK